MKIKLLLIVYILLCEVLYSQTTVKINNTKPRLDTDGQYIDAHDGRIAKYGDKYYWYGTSYGDTNGFLKTNNFCCYSSTDLMNWKNEGVVLRDKPVGIYYRPHVIYNEQTRKYILWYNWYPEFWDGKLGVATSDFPQGPFELVNDDVAVVNSELGLGDFSLFVDDDEQAYLAYNTIDGHKLSVEKLNDEYTASTFENGGIITDWYEAGAIFNRNGTYYLLTDFTCCFCSQGTGVRVYTSDNPMSGYQFRENINRYPGTSTPSLVDGCKTPNQYATIHRRANQTFSPVEIHFSEKTTFASLVIYQFTGNRTSADCGDISAVKLHELIDTPELDLFEKEGAEWKKLDVKTTVENTSVYNIIRLDFSPVTSKTLQLRANSKYRYDQIYLNELQFLTTENEPIPSNIQVSAYINDVDPMRALPIIPAQQTFVMPLETVEGTKLIWMGDLWGSAPDNVKGHDIQYWGTPLIFDPDGNIEPMEWTDEWSFELNN